MKPQADISVLSGNYNNAPYLDDFFQSIINSSLQPKELIFIDDGSPDNSLEMVEKYKHLPYLKLIALEENIGRSASLNEGKKHCTATYTLLIDPDDILMPDRIEKQYRFMKNHPEIDVCGGNVEYFNGQTGEKLNESRFPEKNIYETFKKGENGVLQPTVIIKTEIYQKYDYKNLVPGQDYDLFARMAKDGYRFANLPDVLNRMRVHPGSAVSNMTYKSLSKIFDSRDEIFGTQSPQLKKYFYYLHLKYYRQSMLAESKAKKYFFMALAAAAYPVKILKRLR
jgi:glycosyltransferase involved in cell wall biosynthesis